MQQKGVSCTNHNSFHTCMGNDITEQLLIILIKSLNFKL